MVIGSLKAYSNPKSGVRRPLKVYAADGPMPVVIVDEDGNVIAALPTESVGIREYDEGNSFSEQVGANGKLEGEPTPNLDYSSLLLYITTTQDSEGEGLTVQTGVMEGDVFIPEHFHDYTVKANKPHGMHLACDMTGTHYRVVYSNGPIAADVVIRSTLCKVSGAVHSHNVVYPFDDHHIVTLGRTVVSGKRPDGTYGNLKINPKGAAFTHECVHELPGIDFHMTRDTGVSDELLSPADKDTRQIQVKTPASWNIGDKFEMNSEYDLITVKDKVGDILTLDRILDVTHAADTPIYGRSVNMAAAATPASPLYYRWPNQPSVLSGIWHIHTLNITFSSTVEPSLGRFGGSDPLPYGVQFRKVSPGKRNETYWIPFRTLNSMELSGFEYIKEDKVLTLWYTHLSISLVALANSVITIDMDAGEYWEMILVDDNTQNTTMETKVGAHRELLISEEL